MHRYVTLKMADGRSTMTVDVARLYAIKCDDNNVIHPTEEQKRQGASPKKQPTPTIFIDTGERGKEPPFTLKGCETSKEILAKLKAAGAKEFHGFDSMDGKGKYFVDPARIYAVQGDDTGCAIYIETSGRNFQEPLSQSVEDVLAVIGGEV